jgi:phospholipid/cholesterol/gamma-HCH transport system substrate-binding protein
LVTFALLVALVVTVVVVRTSSPGDYIIRARFADIDGLKPASEVRLDGAQVGSVQSLRLAPDDSVIATLTIKPSAAPVSRDATAQIRDANLLGGKFVDIAPGYRGNAAPSGTMIPESRTGAPVDLDQVLDVLDPTTRARLDILISSTGLAFDGRGADFAELLRQLPPALDRTGALVSQFSVDNAALARLLQESSQLVAAITPQRRVLGALVDNADGAMAATASRQQQLAATIDQAPGLIYQLNETLGQLDATMVPLRPAVVALQESAVPLTGVLRQLPPLEPAAVSTLREVRAVAPALTRLGTGATPFILRLEPTAARLEAFANAFDPVSSTLDTGIVNVLRTIEGWARSIQLRDGASHMFRNELVLSPQLVTTLTDGFLAPSTARARHRHQLAPSTPPRRVARRGASQPAPRHLTGSLVALLDYLLEP